MKNDYSYQSKANIACLIEDMEYQERKITLEKIFDQFDSKGVNWGLACSMNLFLRGIVDEFHDLDIIVNSKDISTVKEIMEQNGAILVETGGNGFCESETYLHYQFGRVDIDIIAGFQLITFGTNFIYHFCKEELEYVNVETRKIPLISMEAMYLLYSMMEGWQPKRRYKRILIDEYLKTVGTAFPYILEKALHENLPGWIKQNIKDIL